MVIEPESNNERIENVNIISIELIMNESLTENSTKGLQTTFWRCHMEKASEYKHVLLVSRWPD